ncbi:acetate/propionate family kinase [Candidatus Woesearchaeota archaeon]|nr:acetate/propionate family kinase [Candidatus Woesearchaeota archaeon]
MEGRVLIINIGSTSKKYALYSDKMLCTITLNNDLTGYYKSKQTTKLKINSKEYKYSINFIINFLVNSNLIKSKDEINKIVIRIVSPGIYFQKNRLIDKEFISKLKIAKSMAPLHISPTLEEIKLLKKEFPRTKLIAISDSAFHSTLPDVAKYYAIPKNHSDYLQIYRYGYHGISIKSVLEKIKGKLPDKIIICHLGGGSSITAIKNGKSIDTSMGFTPLEGIPMGSRSGNLDPSIIIYLLKNISSNPNKLDILINQESGLLGLSQYSSSLKDLIKNSNFKSSKLAIDKFVYEIKKYIGSYYSILGDLDLLIFTGAIGYNSEKIRNLICKDLPYLNKVKIIFIETNELEQMFKESNNI